MCLEPAFAVLVGLVALGQVPDALAVAGHRRAWSPRGSGQSGPAHVSPTSGPSCASTMSG